MTEPCKEWTKGRTKDGYGSIYRDGRTTYVHRNEWERVNGPIPPGLCVLHRCDNRACYEIEHLFLGTRRQNSEDMAAKGRSTIGERNPNARLTEAMIVGIRQRANEGESQRAIARTLGFHQSTINSIIRGATWSRVQ